MHNAGGQRADIAAFTYIYNSKQRQVYRFLAIVFFFISVVPGYAQGVQQVTILPANPSPADTIRVISEFNYNGNCVFGMVGVFANTIGTDIYVYPTYCGYGDSSLCSTTDTFVLDPMPAGTYTLHIEYHQGSVCPFSGFDATIDSFSITLTVSSATSTGDNANENIDIEFYLFPNPAGNEQFMKFKNPAPSGDFHIQILTLAGNEVCRFSLMSNTGPIRIPFELSSGIYLVRLIEKDETVIQTGRLVRL